MEDGVRPRSKGAYSIERGEGSGPSGISEKTVLNESDCETNDGMFGNECEGYTKRACNMEGTCRAGERTLSPHVRDGGEPDTIRTDTGGRTQFTNLLHCK